MIELCFFSAETAFPYPQALLLSDNRIVSVGELFVIDFTDSNNPMSSNIVLLEWDLNCILMKEISSPKEIKVLKNESEIPDEILLLGINADNTISQFGDDQVLKFEWSAIDRGGVERNSEIKISILIKAKQHFQLLGNCIQDDIYLFFYRRADSGQQESNEILPLMIRKYYFLNH